ncbi:putative disease resistance RPP13-like protein 1 [Lolium rigidum]|uniref:putative disease resistance RPP13-like protein 1 n=1 Tax=Lolium rigidum TaxID=89674 RepID=UPI001F5DC064|nr:putative disease resistance RPP13-like protein 1 [Lolium rigidum]
MAVVLDALAPYVKKMISDLAEEEVSMLLGVEVEIRKLNGNLVYLQDYLTDADRKRITDKSVKVWVGKLKDVMYEASDILELCQLEAMERPEERPAGGGASNRSSPLGRYMKKKLQGCFQPLLFCLRNPVFAHETGSRIKKLNEDLDTIRKDATKLNFINLGSYQERRKLTNPARPRNKTTSGYNKSEAVGENIEEDAEQLVQKLIAHDGRDFKVVAIVGQGGMGKSFLAKKIFASETIKEEFKTKIWLSVTQHFDKVELLRSAITHAGGEHNEEKDESILERTLTEALSANKFLLVLDDLWSDTVWKDILQVPVANASCTQPGSRVMITSRKEDVARRVGASGGNQLRVRKLEDEDAWSLLKKQLPLPEVSSENSFDHLKDIGIKIIAKCDGLPLAIKVMGGLLSTRRPSKVEWENVLKKNLEWKEDGLHEELNFSVHLSYDDLTPELKQCFLYYSLFAKGSAPSFEQVVSMWISEGFIQGDGSTESDELDLQEIGEAYHRELVARNLLEADNTDWNTWCYSMHDVVRSFAQFVASEEALVVRKDQNDLRNLLLANQKIRRLSLNLDDSELEWSILENLESLRTLMINCSTMSSGSFASFVSLRVLNMDAAVSDLLLDSVCQLKLLRYLRLVDADISRLPEDIHKIKFLEFLGLVNCKGLNKIPDNITKLAGLRYLDLTGCNVDTVPRGFGGFKIIHSIFWFPAKMDGDWCSLEELGPLCHLRSLSIQYLENMPDCSFAARAMLSNKKDLTYLELGCYRDEDVEMEEGQIEEQQRIEGVFDELCPPPCLEDLILVRYFGRRLPNWMQAPAAAAFKSLKSIVLRSLTYCVQLPNGLCEMVNLEEMEINIAPAIKLVGPDFQSLASRDGGAIVTSPFPKLRILAMVDFSRWKKWDWEEEQGKAMAMPALEHLRIISCKLTHLPLGLSIHNRYNLRVLYLEDLTILASVENFPSVVTFDVLCCPKLKKIGGFSKLRKIFIDGCPKLKLLEGVPVLSTMVLDDETWEITGTPARCTPKLYQVGLQRQLPENFTVTR